MKIVFEMNTFLNSATRRRIYWIATAAEGEIVLCYIIRVKQSHFGLKSTEMEFE